MKTLKLVLSIMVVAFFICNESLGQPIKTDVIITMSGLDYGPGIGLISGTYSYQMAITLDDNSFIKSMHWNVKSCNLHNENGDKVKVIDSGMDTKGVMWDFWNNPAFHNTGWPIDFNYEDGWLEDMMPAVLPVEGTYANMSAKVKCKGTTYDLGGLLVLHINANGVITANVVKGWLLY